jgi:hypothetical protein
MNEENELSGESEDVLKEDDFVNELNRGESGAPEEDSPGLTAREGHEDEKKRGANEKREISSLFADFMKNFQGEPTPEGKIRLSIEFMRAALSNSGIPRFKDFWEGRKQCLPLFKENIAPKVRSQLWSSYVELSTEAKRLKEILDEQSAFAIEQIELAIQALERDLENYDLLLSQSEAPVLLKCVTLQDKEEFYNQVQKELLLLNTLAARVNAMRKEVVKTEMRIRIKNKLLERLSLCGDRIFPRRKELIKKISQEFMSDVDKFIESYFQDEEFKDLHLYSLREEIKQLQSIAKILTLNTHAFTETRVKLSNCWDKIKNREKERKKETQIKKQEYKQNFDLVIEKIKPFSEACMAGLSVDECNKQAEEILNFMKSVELGRDEVRLLKDEIHKAKRGPLDRARSIELERQNKEREAETKRRSTINTLKEELNSLCNQAASLDADVLMSKRDQLHKQFEEVALAKAERQIVDRLFKQLKDILDEKKEKALLMLSEDDQKALDQLKIVLEERKLRRQEIKIQLENYRKLLGGSGFDFEKAMMYREMIEAEKAILEKINSSIDEIEEKIVEIEG